MIYSLKSTNEDSQLATGSSSFPHPENGKINIQDLVNSMRPHVYSHSSLLFTVIDMMEPAEREEFALLLSQDSSDADLLRYDGVLLRRLSELLNSWTAFYNLENAQQQLRIDTAIQAQLIAKEIRQIRHQPPKAN